MLATRPQAPRSAATGVTVAVALGAVLTLGGCGGGSNGGVFVNSMSASPVGYARTMVITVAGAGLSNGIQLKVPSGCGEVTEIAGGDNTVRRFSCKVNALGALTPTVSTADGKEVARLTVDIPPPEVTMTVTQGGTSLGSIVMLLDPLKAPVSVTNFLDYVNTGFYRNTVFHRVIKEFVIQAGGYTAGTTAPVLKTPTSPAITLESNNGLSNVRGSVAMARTIDPNSATSQFYINVVDNLTLDYKSAAEPGYAVFGTVTAGLDVVDTIRNTPTRNAGAGLTDVPVTAVLISSAVQTK